MIKSFETSGGYRKGLKVVRGLWRVVKVGELPDDVVKARIPIIVLADSNQYSP